MALPASFLTYANYRHLKLALLALAIAIFVYAIVDPVGGRSGDTWVGYSLGGVCAALVFWLLWFGVRKRRYGGARTPLHGWLSAHAYLGTTLLLLVPLHCAFEFGWNVHTLAYGLVVLVVLSGFAGVASYTFTPTAVTRDRAGRRFSSFLQEIADIDFECRAIAQQLPDAFASATALSIEHTRLTSRFVSRKRPCATTQALTQVRTASVGATGDVREGAGRLSELLTRKLVLLRAIRRDLRQRSLMTLWLLVHVPVSIAALAAILVHVFAVFYYW